MHDTSLPKYKTSPGFLLAQNREVTLQQVSQALGKKGTYWHMCCGETGFVHELIRQHNIRVRQQKDEVVFVQIAARS